MRPFICCVIVISLFGLDECDGIEPLVIAHRGASGYLPEHTLEAAAAACVMGADYVEQDVVLTSDNQPIVLHDLNLGRVTNVADVFPHRRRADGKFYAIDFSLAEIRVLKVTERLSDEGGEAARYPSRFPIWKSAFRVSTLAEHIELIQGLNKTLDREIGVYVEVKSPAWHRKQGKDISQAVISTLRRYGYEGAEAKAYLQCFDAHEARRIRVELDCRLKIVQLIGDDDRLETPAGILTLRSDDGLKATAQYADGIGPWLPHVVSGRTDDGQFTQTDLVKRAHAHGLVVHVYTLRADALPHHAADFGELADFLFGSANVDGAFTDFPDRVIPYRDRHARAGGAARSNR